MMYGKNSISREDEAKIPEFNSHDDARAWFKEKYGENFVLTSSEVIDERKIYFYHLILDRNNYDQLQENLQNGKGSVSIELMFSYQSVEIDANGYIHVIH